MKGPVPYRLVFLLLGVFFVHGSALAQGPAIALHSDGALSWTNANTNALFNLEWAPRLDNSWQRWDSYVQSPITGAAMTVDVPMYFRLEVNTNVNKFVPPDGQVLLLIGQDTNTIDQYVASNNIVPGGVMLYTSVQNAEGLYVSVRPVNAKRTV